MIAIQTSNFGVNSAIRCTNKIGKYNLDSHIHYFSEIVFVRGGSINVTVDGRCERAEKDDIVVITPFQVHKFKTENFCDIWLCVFSNDFISDFVSGNGSCYTGEKSVFTPTYELLNFFKSKLIDSGECFVEYDAKIFRAMKSAIYAVFEEYFRTVPASAYPVYGSVISDILIYMKEHCKEDISLSLVGNALGYSPGYISHCLKSGPAMNFRTLLNSFRIEHAKNLILSGKYKMIDIALECGFSGERTFYRAFLQTVGISPGEYKKSRLNL